MPFLKGQFIYSLFREDREDKDMTYFKTYIYFHHYLMLYFMTNPSERTKKEFSSILSSPSLL